MLLKRAPFRFERRYVFRNFVGDVVETENARRTRRLSQGVMQLRYGELRMNGLVHVCTAFILLYSLQVLSLRLQISPVFRSD